MSTADRRQQIIDTARTVFATRGFRGATTREIAAAAGITEAVIFQHFADKQALYDAILEQKADELSTDRWFEALANLKSLPPPSALPPDVVAALNRTYEYDPASVAARVRVPVLNVFGGKDRHIPVEPSVAALKAA